MRNVYPLLLLVLVSCGDSQTRESEGEVLAKKHCGSCHVFPDPGLLHKEAWRTDVLPAMARRLNIDHVFETQVHDENIVLAVDDWKKIVGYYIKNSPDTLKSQERRPVAEVTSLFKTLSLANANAVRPSISFVSIDTSNSWIVAADAVDSTLTIYNTSLQKVSSNKVNGIVVDAVPDEHSGRSIFTLIGIMRPNDLRTGSIVAYEINKHGKLDTASELLSALPRPVQTIPFKFTAADEVWYLICAFGNNTGGLYLTSLADTSRSLVLNESAGAIRAYTGDFNRDSITDVIALNAQSKESIDVYYGTKDRRFNAVNLLSFPPIYGSTYFELADFNADGHPDIVYSCGDNADYTGSTLKYYHGVYIFLNDGKFNFSQRYFFPQHGTIKSIARDFDLDGDLDILSISFFPDMKRQPQESIVFLENSGNFSFAPSTIPGFDRGRWMTLDAADMDDDGDEDVIIGSMQLPFSGTDSMSDERNTSLLLSENTRRVRTSQ